MKTPLMIVIILSIFLTKNEISAQSQQLTEKFIITDASINGIDYTPQVIKDMQYIVFYSDDEEQLYMANVVDEPETQSYGPVYNLQHEEDNETYQIYTADVYYFQWYYINTYDDKKGTAKAQFTLIHKPQGVAFILKIIPEDLEYIVYRGYQEGTVDFSIFD